MLLLVAKQPLTSSTGLKREKSFKGCVWERQVTTINKKIYFE